MPTKTQTHTYPASTRGSYSYVGGSSADVASTGAVSFVRTRTGVALPNWRALIAAEENATTALTARWETGETFPGRCRLDYWGTSGTTPNAYAGWDRSTLVDVRKTGGSPASRGPQAPSVDGSFADNQARSKFYKKLRQEAVQWSAPTFLGELGEALRMIKRPASAIRDSTFGYINALRKEKRKNPRYWSRAAGGLWLEYAFGWSPLIQDSMEAYQAYQRLLEKASRKKIISAGYIQEVDTSSGLTGHDRGVHNSTIVGFQRWVCLRAVRKEKVMVRYKAKMRNRVSATKWDNWALFGFESKEFIPTAWQLLPWSFLIDYFFNVDSVLNAVITDAKDVRYVNKSVVKSTLYEGSLTIDPVKSGQDRSMWNTKTVASDVVAPGWKYTRKDVTRSSMPAVPLPTLSLNFDLSNGQLFNIAALLASAFSLHPQNKPRHYPRIKPIRGPGFN